MANINDNHEDNIHTQKKNPRFTRIILTNHTLLSKKLIACIIIKETGHTGALKPLLKVQLVCLVLGSKLELSSW